MLTLEEFIDDQWLNTSLLSEQYSNAKPFPHIVMKSFIKNDLINNVLNEFPDLSQINNTIRFNNEKEVKFASKGMEQLSPSAFYLCSFLNSNIFLRYLQSLTSINEKLISDPYMEGGGYHEIKKGGLLKVHADFSKHSSKLNLDRRLNLIIYLNKDWNKNWGGCLSLFDENIKESISVSPDFNTAILFSTNSKTYHGHPDALNCPENISRKSLALYYFSTGRPSGEIIGKHHGTLFKKRVGEKFRTSNLVKIQKIAKGICPPFIWATITKIRDKLFY